MDNVISTFPLLHLPIDAILHTFRCMNHLPIFGISILSKKARNLVESLKLAPRTFQVLVREKFDVILHFHKSFSLHFQFYQVEENEPLQELGTPANFLIYSEASNVRWTNSMSVKQLIDHLQSIFHSSIDYLSLLTNFERFNVESIHGNVKNVKHIILSTTNHEDNRRALSLFQSPSMSLETPALINRCVPRYILIQNFNYIRASNVQNTLDDLLMTNVCFINLTSSRSLTKIVNKFLKLWVKGSNSRLECLHFQFPGNLQNEELLSGLKYENAPLHRTRYFKTACMKKPLDVIGGWDFWRFDGTQATIQAEKWGDFFHFHLFVWHDHCLVDQFYS